MQQRKIPSVHVIFDFRHRATRSKPGVVNICVAWQGKRKYFSTGVRVYPQEWDRRGAFVKNRVDAGELNDRIEAIRKHINAFVTQAISERAEFSLDALTEYLGARHTHGEDFAGYIRGEIEKDNTLARPTKRKYLQTVSYLKQFGKIRTFRDVTQASVLEWLNWLHGKGYRQQTVHSLYKTLRRYVNTARMKGLIDGDPLMGIRVPRGEAVPERWLTEEEVAALAKADIRKPLDKVRDTFLVQCYTGLAYSDLPGISPDRVSPSGGLPVLTGYRRKTGQMYTVPLLPECQEILARYAYRLPLMTLEQYNMRLKAVADICGIDKPIASHWGRRTCGMILLNRGVSIEVVAKILGHADIRTTQQCYAKILSGTVVEAMRKIMGGSQAAVPPAAGL